MPPELTAAVILAGIVALCVYAYLRRGVCGLRVTRGRVEQHYGVMPAGPFGDVRDALRGSRASGRIIVLSGAKFAQVELVGTFTENERQRVRNVLGNVPITRFRR